MFQKWLRTPALAGCNSNATAAVVEVVVALYVLRIIYTLEYNMYYNSSRLAIIYQIFSLGYTHSSCSTYT